MTSPIAREAAEGILHDFHVRTLPTSCLPLWPKPGRDYSMFPEVPVERLEAIIQSHLAQAIKESGAIEALERAIQYVPYNAINAKQALTEPIDKCRTIDFCEATLSRLRALSGAQK